MLALSILNTKNIIARGSEPRPVCCVASVVVGDIILSVLAINHIECVLT